jgi:hypothetical protein
MPNTALGWLIVGAVVGFILVVVGHNVFGLQIEGWLAAIITTVSAVVVAGAGPTGSPVPVEQPNRTPVPG